VPALSFLPVLPIAQDVPLAGSWNSALNLRSFTVGVDPWLKARRAEADAFD